MSFAQLNGYRCLHLYRSSLTIKVQKSTGEWVIDRIPAPPEGDVIVGWPYGEILHFTTHVASIDKIVFEMGCDVIVQYDENLNEGLNKTLMLKLSGEDMDVFTAKLILLSRHKG
jgi:hypothetical protein